MGLLIFCPDERAPLPRAVVLELTCDGDHGLFPPTPARFEQAGGFITQHAAAIRVGWLETFDQRGRVFLGPCCSGKRVGSGSVAPGEHRRDGGA